MPLARIRTYYPELALDLAEELYGLGFTVETISFEEFRTAPAEIEIELQALDPLQLESIVATSSDDYQKIFLMEGVVELLPQNVQLRRAETLTFGAEEPIDVPIEAPASGETPSTVDETVPALYPAIARQRSRRIAEAVAATGAAVGKIGLFIADRVDSTRAWMRAQIALRQRPSIPEPVRMAEPVRASEVAPLERVAPVASESISVPEIPAEPVVHEPIAVQEFAEQRPSPPPPQEAPKPRPIPVQVPITISQHSKQPVERAPLRLGRRSPAPVRVARLRPRSSPIAALKLGAAVGLLGMMLIVGFANRRPASPVGLGELTRSTTVTQSAPFGSAEVKPVAVQNSVIAAQTVSSVEVPKSPARGSRDAKRSSRRVAREMEPEVVVRHYTPRTAAVRASSKQSDIKRFSDLE